MRQRSGGSQRRRVCHSYKPVQEWTVLLHPSLCQVMLDFFSLTEVADALATRGPCPGVMNLVPVSTRKNVYVHPHHLSMNESAKYGAVGKFPSNVAIRAHFSSIVQRGYEAEREALEIKFPVELAGSGKQLPLFSVEYIDGHAKAVMVHAVFALLDHLASRSIYCRCLLN